MAHSRPQRKGIGGARRKFLYLILSHFSFYISLYPGLTSGLSLPESLQILRLKLTVLLIGPAFLTDSSELPAHSNHFSPSPS